MIHQGGVISAALQLVVETPLSWHGWVSQWVYLPGTEMSSDTKWAHISWILFPRKSAMNFYQGPIVSLSIHILQFKGRKELKVNQVNLDKGCSEHIAGTKKMDKRQNYQRSKERRLVEHAEMLLLSWALDLWVIESLGAFLLPSFTVSFHYNFPQNSKYAFTHTYISVYWCEWMSEKKSVKKTCQKLLHKFTHTPLHTHIVSIGWYPSPARPKESIVDWAFPLTAVAAHSSYTHTHTHMQSEGIPLTTLVFGLRPF